MEHSRRRRRRRSGSGKKEGNGIVVGRVDRVRELRWRRSSAADYGAGGQRTERALLDLHLPLLRVFVAPTVFPGIPQRQVCGNRGL